jgi:hypothetical protein
MGGVWCKLVRGRRKTNVGSTVTFASEKLESFKEGPAWAVKRQESNRSNQRLTGRLSVSQWTFLQKFEIAYSMNSLMPVIHFHRGTQLVGLEITVVIL